LISISSIEIDYRIGSSFPSADSFPSRRHASSRLAISFLRAWRSFMFSPFQFSPLHAARWRGVTALFMARWRFRQFFHASVMLLPAYGADSHFQLSHDRDSSFDTAIDISLH